MFSTLFAGLALVAGAPALKDPPAKPATVEGEWTVESVLVGGKPDGVIQQNPINKIVITSDKWIVVRGGKPAYETNLTLDPKQDPPHLDLAAPIQGADVTKAIYKLDGDTLIICYVQGGDRPAKVESPTDSNVRMVTLKRLNK
jgi:uncharacterized protein (TIGR03067 family)